MSCCRAFRHKNSLTYLPLLTAGLEKVFEKHQSCVTGAIAEGITVTKEVMKLGSDSKFRKYQSRLYLRQLSVAAISQGTFPGAGVALRL